MQTGCPYDINLIGFFRTFNAIRDERILHRKFSKHHVKGEWFRIPDIELGAELDRAKRLDISYQLR